MKRLRRIMENESSESDFMELSDDVFEDSGDGDDITTSEIEQSHEAQEPKRSQNPFIKYCQDQRKVAAEYLEKCNVELTEELSKKMMKVVAEDWKALPTKERKQSASQKWYSEEFLLPLFTDNLKEEDIAEQWEQWQQKRPIQKNIVVDKDVAELLVTLGNSRSHATCTLEEPDVSNPAVLMVTVRGPQAEVNLAINVMLDEETRLILAINNAVVPKLKEKRFTTGQVNFQIKRQQIADRLKEGKRIPKICKELNCSDTLVYKVKKMIENNESLAPKTAPGGTRIRNKEFLRNICAMYGADPFMSFTKGAEELGVDRTTVGSAVRELGMNRD